MTVDPKSAALYSIIAICFVLIGAILTPGTVGIDQRAALLAAIAGILLVIGFGFRMRRGGGDGGE